ncbi:MAG TPA: hypothetical protein DIT01_10065 [Lentisphaeria bacterium]|nr:hypothetical protein [Lentisphaeria bacterium]|tara:strand:+ start:894 stop:2357 length:1464 start_codon:yes stop_codon:yes gene_type:complete
MPYNLNENPESASPEEELETAPPDETQWHRLFLRIGLVFGVAWILLIPPFQTPDEYNHFYRAISFAQGRLCCHPVIGESGTGAVLPGALIQTEEKLAARDISVITSPSKQSNPQDLARLIAAFDVRMRQGDTRYYDFANTCNYPVIGYVPQTIISFIGYSLNLPVLIVLYLIRCANLIVYLAIVWWALKQMPVLKPALFLLALMPMSLQQAMAPGADSIINVAAFLFLAIILRLTLDDSRETIGGRTIVGLTVLAAIIAVAKIAYLPLCLLCLMLPAAKFENRRVWTVTMIAVPGIAAVLLAGWLLFVRQSGLPHLQAAGPDTIGAIIDSPWSALLFYLQNIYNNMTLPLVYEQFVGRLGWLDTPVPMFFVIAFLGMLLVAVAAEPAPAATARALGRPGLVAGLVFLVSVFVLHALFVTVSNSMRIVQGRYFIPLAMSALFCLYCGTRGRLRIPAEFRVKPWIFAACSVLTLTVTSIVVFRRYWFAA